ncbi:MAG: hypothetical protein E7443_04560 [Ruminococcaceae bacterium]|nr:hypothetical protein [Oscillospiraceae bacterium]
MFEAFVSLGASCPVAAAMGRAGLRSFSGPFDWLVTRSFSSVLHFMETDFCDFLLPEHLARFPGNPRWFIDSSCDFKFLHDREDFQTEYTALKQKYDRRIKHFTEASRKKACFLRAVTRAEEIDYIRSNAAYIQSVICRTHPENELVLLFKKELPVPEDLPFRCFQMKQEYGDIPYLQMRRWFDGAADFLSFCAAHYDPQTRARNLSIDRLQLLEKAERAADFK